MHLLSPFRESLLAARGLRAFRAAAFVAAGTVAVSIISSAAPPAKDPKRPAVAAKPGIKTPGIQIPLGNLKPEAEFKLDGPVPALLFVPGPAPSAWVANRTLGTLIKIDSKTNKAADPVKEFKQPCGLVNAFGSLWVAQCGDMTVARVEAKSSKVTATLPYGVGGALPAIVSTEDSIWLLSDDKTTLSRIDPQGNLVVSELRLPKGCRSLLSAAGSLWVTSPTDNKLLRINPRTNLVEQRIEVLGQPTAAVFGENSIWVLASAEGKVVRIDPKTNKSTATIDLGLPDSEGSLAFGEGAVWVSVSGFPITQIDPQTDKVVKQLVGDGGGMIQTGLGSLWLANLPGQTLWRIDPKRLAATLPE
jgi:streptogramin lyase